MPTLTWHPDALADIARLHQFLAEQSPAAAPRGAGAIIKAAHKILKNPGSARHVPSSVYGLAGNNGPADELQQAIRARELGKPILRLMQPWPACGFHRRRRRCNRSSSVSGKMTKV